MNKYAVALPILLEADARKKVPQKKWIKTLKYKYSNVFMNVVKKDLPIFIAMGYVFLHHAISRIIKGINGAILYGVLYILMSADIVRHFLWKSIWNDVSPLGKRLFKVGRSRGWCTKCSSLAEGPYHIALDTILWAKLIWFLELAFPDFKD